MGIEDGPRPKPITTVEKIDPNLEAINLKRKAHIDRDLEATGGMASDYHNAWFLVYAFGGTLNIKLSDLESVEHYETYIRDPSNNLKEIADYIMAQSNKERIAAIDRLADEFNTDLDRIKEEEDIEAVRDFGRRALILIYGEEEAKARYGF